MAGDETENPNSPNPSHSLPNVSAIDSAYTFTTGDTSNASIIYPPFNSKNYYSWSCTMLMAIGAHNKFGFLDGSITKPVPIDPNFSVWYRCNLMVSPWICVFVSPKIAQVILYIDLAEKMWKLLIEWFEQSNEPRIFELHQAINAITQSQSFVNDYFTRLESLWNELHQFWRLLQIEKKNN